MTHTVPVLAGVEGEDFLKLPGSVEGSYHKLVAPGMNERSNKRGPKHKTPDNVVEPKAKYDVPYVPIDETRWKHFIAILGAGATLGTSMHSAKIKRFELESDCRVDPLKLREYTAARKAGRRKYISIENIEKALINIASGMNQADACKDAGISRELLLEIVMENEELQVQYKKALELRALGMTDDVTRIADDNSEDVDMMGKGNIAAVNRSRLKVDARRWLMESWSPKMFKPQGKTDVNINVQVNHAARLEEARTRRDVGVTVLPPSAQARLEPPTEDAEFTDASEAQDDTGWLDL